jgi:hypothetical protein
LSGYKNKLAPRKNQSVPKARAIGRWHHNVGNCQLPLHGGGGLVMTSTFIRPSTHATSVSGQSRVKTVWENLKGELWSILKRTNNAARLDELDRYEGARFERLIESLDRAERIRRNSKT